MKRRLQGESIRGRPRKKALRKEGNNGEGKKTKSTASPTWGKNYAQEGDHRRKRRNLEGYRGEPSVQHDQSYRGEKKQPRKRRVRDPSVPLKRKTDTKGLARTDPRESQ